MRDRVTAIIHLITLFKADDKEPVGGTLPVSLLRDIANHPLWIGSGPLDVDSYLGHKVRFFGVDFTVVTDGDCTVTGADGTVRALKEAA